MTRLFKNNYFALRFLGMFAMMLYPFFSMAKIGVVEEGAGRSTEELEDELLGKIDDKIEKSVKDRT